MASLGLAGFQVEHGIGGNRHSSQASQSHGNGITASLRTRLPPNSNDASSVADKQTKSPVRANHGGAESDLHEIVDQLDLLRTDEDNSASSQHVLRDLVLIQEDDEDGLANLAMIIHSLVSVTGEYILALGVAEDGSSMALSREEWERAKRNVARGAEKASLECSILLDHPEPKAAVPPSDKYPDLTGKAAHDRGTYFLIRRRPEGAEDLIELRIAVIGNVDAGKSTLLGVLTKGGLDDGRGRARVNLFRHKHEIESGRTSSVGMEIMGFKASGGAVIEEIPKGSSEPGRRLAWDEICKRSAKVISFIDLAGHEKYLKTTVFGMTGCAPDFCLIMVGANAGLIGMSKEHLGIALALAVPVVVCITKIDMTPPNVLESTIKQLIKILKSAGCRKQPVFVDDFETVISSAPKLSTERICPIFQVSNVTGQGLDLLRTFLDILPPATLIPSLPGPVSEQPFEYQISDVFSVPFVGTVVSGVIMSGMVRTGDNMLLGPDSLGQFQLTGVKSIHRKRVPVQSASIGQSASFSLKRVRRQQVRKGMVMLSRRETPPHACMEFDAEVLVLYHSTTISINYQAMLHCSSIRQTVRIVDIIHNTREHLEGKGDAIEGAEKRSTRPTRGPSTGSSRRSGDTKAIIRTGDRALVRFQFIRHPEYLKPGLKLLFREGKTKGLGVIKQVY